MQEMKNENFIRFQFLLPVMMNTVISQASRLLSKSATIYCGSKICG